MKLKYLAYFFPFQAEVACISFVTRSIQIPVLALSAHQSSLNLLLLQSSTDELHIFPHKVPIHQGVYEPEEKNKCHWLCWWVKKSRQHTFTALPMIHFLQTTTKPVKIVSMHIIKIHHILSTY